MSRSLLLRTALAPAVEVFHLTNKDNARVEARVAHLPGGLLARVECSGPAGAQAEINGQAQIPAGGVWVPPAAVPFDPSAIGLKGV